GASPIANKTFLARPLIELALAEKIITGPDLDNLTAVAATASFFEYGKCFLLLLKPSGFFSIKLGLNGFSPLSHLNVTPSPFHFSIPNLSREGFQLDLETADSSPVSHSAISFAFGNTADSNRILFPLFLAISLICVKKISFLIFRNSLPIRCPSSTIINSI